MLLAHASKNPNTDVVVKAAKSGGVVSIEAVNHRAGWRLAFEQGPVPDFATAEMTSESALLSVCKVISGHIDMDEDGVPDAHFDAHSALAVENSKLKDDLAATKTALDAAKSAIADLHAEAVIQRNDPNAGL